MLGVGEEAQRDSRRKRGGREVGPMGWGDEWGGQDIAICPPRHPGELRQEAWVAVVLGVCRCEARGKKGREALSSYPHTCSHRGRGRRSTTSDYLPNLLGCSFHTPLLGLLCLTDSFMGTCVVINMCSVGPGPCV